ncbi:prepilin peptidase [Limnohabitans lacus]|jgi:leader peptidase (prepilin peptidase)/N-methyltransferase|uniref:Prepilin leader peptidase/N-methyltransferase n=1 Tax=Limnohabitans lacus TaxID=3045173 RepID=A0ABT6X852_9BURK|nr:A24 family peptidase [Limnohabitans sp. HM2-2]MDI9234154.1 A24 family peptidase [Limnohabitans sp. HM2-2]
MPIDFFSWTLIALFGLVVGSFLNVVIHRLPRMLEAQWAAEAREQAGLEAAAEAPYNLALPRSHCPHCQTPLRWWDNIPALSYLWLRGRCRQCQAPIGWRYLAVELLTSALFVWSFAANGVSASAMAWAGFAAALVALAAIDADTTLLPDAITQPLVWSGLLAASLQWSAQSLSQALWGAVAGYLFLWTVYWLFKLLTGKDGMGQGDFKLLAALGAWLGWPSLVSLVLIASLTGVAGGLLMRARGQLYEDGYIPFGPFLAFAGLWVMVWGPLPGLQL